MITLPHILQNICQSLISKHYRPVVVGGYVRDTLQGMASKDIDIEVFGVQSLDDLEILLNKFGKVNSVGKSFGVLKLQLEKTEVDFSIPRQEKKVGQGHKGFEVTLDGALSFKEAALRRDFTINAMGFDIHSEKLLDPFDGQKALENKTLHYVNAETFREDPLRLYRAMQFSARFELTPSNALTSLAREMVAEDVLEELPKERVFEEFKKLLIKSKKPSIGLVLMSDWGMLKHFKELLALHGVPQDPIYHPEGDVWIHTLMVVDTMAKLRTGVHKRDLYLMLAALCHDFGKADTTEIIEGKIRAIGHESSGLPLTETFLERLSDEKALTECIMPLVKHHLKPMQFYKQGAKAPAICRLARDVNIEDLVLLAEADFLGRTTPEALKGEFEAGKWLLEHANALQVAQKPLDALLQGRDLIMLGLKPSKDFKLILERAYDAQIEGVFSSYEEALLWLKRDINV